MPQFMKMEFRKKNFFCVNDTHTHTYINQQIDKQTNDDDDLDNDDMSRILDEIGNR